MWRVNYPFVLIDLTDQLEQYSEITITQGNRIIDETDVYTPSVVFCWIAVLHLRHRFSLREQTAEKQNINDQRKSKVAIQIKANQWYFSGRLHL